MAWLAAELHPAKLSSRKVGQSRNHEALFIGAHLQIRRIISGPVCRTRQGVTVSRSFKLLVATSMGIILYVDTTQNIAMKQPMVVGQRHGGVICPTPHSDMSAPLDSRSHESSRPAPRWLQEGKLQAEARPLDRFHHVRQGRCCRRIMLALQPWLDSDSVCDGRRTMLSSC